MGIFGALFASVSALDAQGTSLATISDNIANVSTTGYKATTTRFSSFVTEQARRHAYAAGGVRAAPTQLIDRQGLLEASASATDLGISGKGFFVVKTSGIENEGLFRYTRAGSFNTDKDGSLVNTSGHYLMGWPTDSDGQVIVADTSTTSQLQLVNINNLLNAAVPTTEFSVGANLPATAAVGASHTVTATVFDGLGVAHGVPLSFTRQPSTADATGRLIQNAWNVTSRAPRGASVIELKDNLDNTFSASGRLDFGAIPQEGETLTIGALTFEFDSGDGVAAGNTAINLAQINSAQDAMNAVVKAYHTAFGHFDGQPTVARAAQLNSRGGRFVNEPTIRVRQDGFSNRVFNTLNGLGNFENGTLSLDLVTENGEVKLAGQSNMAFQITKATGDILGDTTAFGQESPDLSGLDSRDVIRVYVKDSSVPNGSQELVSITIPANAADDNAVAAGTDGETTAGALQISGLVHRAGRFPAADGVNVIDSAAGTFPATTNAWRRTSGLPRMAIPGGGDTISLQLETQANGQVRIPVTADLGFAVNWDGAAAPALNTASPDLSGLSATDAIDVFASNGAVPPVNVRIARIIPGGPVTPGEVGAAPALTINGFTFTSEGYAARALGDTVVAAPVAAPAGGTFAAGTTASLQASGVSPLAHALLPLAGAANNELRLDLAYRAAVAAVGGAAPVPAQYSIPSLGPDLAFTLRDDLPGAGGAGAAGDYGRSSPPLNPGDTVNIYVRNAAGENVLIGRITIPNQAFGPPSNPAANGITADALTIGNINHDDGEGGFTQSGPAVGPPTIEVRNVDTGRFPTRTNFIRAAGGVEASILQHLNNAATPPFVNDVLSLDLITTAAGAAVIEGIADIAFKVNDGSNPQPVDGDFGANSPDLSGLNPTDTIDVFGRDALGNTALIATIIPGGPVIPGVAAGETDAALRLSGFAYTAGGFPGAPTSTTVAGITPSRGGDFLPAGTAVSLSSSGVARAAEGILQALGSDRFNNINKTLTLGLETVGDGAGGKQTRIPAVPNLAFVLNPNPNPIGDPNPQPPAGNVPGGFGQPSDDLTQANIDPNHAVDVYADTGSPPTLIARITLGGRLDPVATQIGQTTPNALQISGFNYATDNRLTAGTGIDDKTIFFTQVLGKNTVNIDASGIASIDQDAPFIIPAIVAPNPPNVVFSGQGVPTAFNVKSANIQWANGADASSIALNLGTVGLANGLTQFSDSFSTLYVKQNGVPTGAVSGIDIGQNGVVRALFDNGLSRPIFRLPLATFQNPNALSQDTGNVYIPSSDSGEPLLNSPSTGPTGRIAQNALEASTVDIADEFSKMIITQRAFSAASRVVTTSDEMLDELVRIKR